jgi:hypothetical protein
MVDKSDQKELPFFFVNLITKIFKTILKIPFFFENRKMSIRTKIIIAKSINQFVNLPLPLALSYIHTSKINLFSYWFDISCLEMH